MKKKKKIEQEEPKKWDFIDKMIDGYSHYPSLGAYEYVRSLENIENETEKHHFNEKLEFMKKNEEDKELLEKGTQDKTNKAPVMKSEENSNRCTEPYCECALRNEKGECKDPYSRDEYCIDTTETPLFGQSSEDLAKTLSDAGIKAAKATHEFNMKEIKAKLIADLCVKLVEHPMPYGEIPIRAREIAEKALENL